NDVMTAGTGADAFDGGAGTDTVNYTDRTADLNISLDDRANDGQTFRIGRFTISEGDNVGSTVEIVNAGSGNDVITANKTLSVGGAGTDILEKDPGDPASNFELII